jgi:endonuclease/exonuclease/phosphatase family metal-dependent hydrolase
MDMRRRNRGAVGPVVLGLVALACQPAPPALPGPAGDPAADPLRVAVLSDLNSTYGSTDYDAEVGAVIDRIVHDWRPDLVLIAGDMVAGQRPALSDDRVRAMWAAFDSVVAAPLRRAAIPLAVTIGNHDGSGHPGHERDRRLAREYWHDRRPDVGPGVANGPVMVSGDRYPFRYAFTLGGVFFLVLDASTGAVMADPAQVSWLRATLGRPEAALAGLRVSLGHVPLHAVAEGRDHPGEVQDQPDSLRSILEAGGVRLHVSGHHHAYYPGRRGGLELLHAGALGQGPRALLGDGAASSKTVTLLELYPARDSLAERTYRVVGDTFERIDPAALPPRLHGHNGAVGRSPLLPSRKAPAPADSTATIVSFNIRAGTDLERRPSLDRVAALLDALGADVVLLQEVDRGTHRSGGVDQLAELRRLTGLEGVFGRAIDFDGGEYGIAILSRWRILDSAVVPLTVDLPPGLADARHEPRVVLHVLLDSPWGPLPVLNTHLSHQAWGTYRRQELVGLLGELQRRTGRAGMVIVGGDFNARPDSDEIAAVTLALDDAWRVCGAGDGLTYPSDEPVRRIDYLFLRAASCTLARVPATTVSDHRPLVVDVFPTRLQREAPER